MHESLPKVEPDFKMNDQFVVENLQYVFGIDGLETSRPINIEVNTPEEIASLFDAISYEKGTQLNHKYELKSPVM